MSSNFQTVASEELQEFVDRYERLEAEKKEISDAQKEIMSEVKGRGYDVKVVRAVLACRKKDQDALAEFNDLLETYLAALGM